VTASAWKTSAGAAARVPVALAANLNATLKEFKKRKESFYRYRRFKFKRNF
jgi:tRNA G18 (ribose-2'-O)-methylase SpoU